MFSSVFMIGGYRESAGLARSSACGWTQASAPVCQARASALRTLDHLVSDNLQAVTCTLAWANLPCSRNAEIVAAVGHPPPGCPPQQPEEFRSGPAAQPVCGRYGLERFGQELLGVRHALCGGPAAI